MQLPPGTLYALLAQFLEVDYIQKIEQKGRGKYYRITEKGREILIEEKERLESLVDHFNQYYHDDQN